MPSLTSSVHFSESVSQIWDIVEGKHSVICGKTASHATAKIEKVTCLQCYKMTAEATNGRTEGCELTDRILKANANIDSVKTRGIRSPSNPERQSPL